MEALDAQQRLHARQHFVAVERFGEEIIGPGFDAFDPLFAGIQRRDHHHRQHRGGRIGANRRAHFVAIHVRHHHIEQHEVRRFAWLWCAGFLQAFAAAIGGDHAVALEAEYVGQHAHIGRDVVDHQKAGRRYGRGFGGLAHAVAPARRLAGLAPAAAQLHRWRRRALTWVLRRVPGWRQWRPRTP